MHYLNGGRLRCSLWSPAAIEKQRAIASKKVPNRTTDSNRRRAEVERQKKTGVDARKTKITSWSISLFSDRETERDGILLLYRRFHSFLKKREYKSLSKSLKENL